MPEALWLQATGVEYSAAEDRRLIAAVYTPGVLDGLTITATTGANISVSAGRAIVDDGAGGAYLAYFDAATAKGLPLSSMTTVYVVVNTTTAVATIETGSTPVSPYVTLGSATTDGTSTTAVSNVRAAAAPVSGGASLPLTGGTLTGTLTGTRFLIPGAFNATSAGVTASKGIKFGGASGYTARHYARAYRDTSQNIASGAAPEAINFNITDRAVSDYGITAHNGAGNGRRFYPGVAGDYLLTGSVMFDNVSVSDPGSRKAQVSRYSSTGAQLWSARTDWAQNSGADLLTWSVMMNAEVGDYFMFEVSHTTGKTLTTRAASYASGNRSWANMRLIQAD